MVVEPSRQITGALAPRAPGTVIFVGHARLPQSLASRDASSVISVEMEVNLTNGEIVSTAVRSVPELAGRLVAGLLQGRNVNESPLEVADAIRRRYVCPSQKALSTAVLNAFEAYSRYRQLGLG